MEELTTPEGFRRQCLVPFCHCWPEDEVPWRPLRIAIVKSNLNLKDFWTTWRLVLWVDQSAGVKSNTVGGQVKKIEIISYYERQIGDE